VDLVATLPWELASSSLAAMRLLRLLRLSRVVKKVDSLKGGMALRFFYLIFWWMLIAHWTACLWWFIGKQGWQQERRDYFDGRQRDDNSTNWLVRIPPNGKIETRFSYSAYTACWVACVAASANTSVPLSPVECMSSRECDDNNFNPNDSDEVWNHWLSSFYWAFTMLMKTPYVGPDTLPEKIFSCIMVIIGAIIFALLLGQVTTLIISASKAGATLRDTLVQYRLFAVTRLPRGPQAHKVYSMMANQMEAEWRQTSGMDTTSVLEPFPLQLRGEVLAACYKGLLEVNPPFLRCSEQLRRQVLGVLRPAVALKKSNVVTARQYHGNIYILMKGTLQVSQPPSDAAGSEPEREETRSPTRKGTSKKGKFKDKLKVRMLEKSGAIIPLENLDTACASPFAVFAVTHCDMLMLNNDQLMGVLKAHPESDKAIVCDALNAEYKALVKSLEKARPQGEPEPEAKVAAAPRKTSKATGIVARVSLMEERANLLIEKMDDLMTMSAMLPEVLKALEARPPSQNIAAQQRSRSMLSLDKVAC